MNTSYIAITLIILASCGQIGKTGSGSTKNLQALEGDREFQKGGKCPDLLKSRYIDLLYACDSQESKGEVLNCVYKIESFMGSYPRVNCTTDTGYGQNPSLVIVNQASLEQKLSQAKIKANYINQ